MLIYGEESVIWYFLLSKYWRRLALKVVETDFFKCLTESGLYIVVDVTKTLCAVTN